ncbi:IniB N-terminal domain-containing protein [Microbacterium istanbulense]|uniref:IniB N-terminal domain-containing protein n=1 Tax=Microbacterium istanbulense TaxID=3122049 RepID=A0ABU8LJA9_9MICO
MTSPVETIADALIAFILSLLRDPDAADGFSASPQAMLAGSGLAGVCAADVAAVKPVIVDHPTVIRHEHPSSPPPPPGGPSGPGDNNGAVQEIVRMIQQFTTIDARSTIVDQSVNQNIWTEGGDVTQLFDQEAVVASGDNSVAAGDDATIVDSDVDVTMGDVSVGNETYDGSFNNTGSEPPADGEADPADVDTAVGTDGVVDEAVDTTVDAVTEATDPAPAPAPEPAPLPADVPEPADVLESDMTSTDDTYDADAASTAAQSDTVVEDPIEDD